VKLIRALETAAAAALLMAGAGIETAVAGLVAAGGAAAGHGVPAPRSASIAGIADAVRPLEGLHQRLTPASGPRWRRRMIAPFRRGTPHCGRWRSRVPPDGKVSAASSTPCPFETPLSHRCRVCPGDPIPMPQRVPLLRPRASKFRGAGTSPAAARKERFAPFMINWLTLRNVHRGRTQVLLFARPRSRCSCRRTGVRR
jgi:hypothetical protein